MDYPFCLSNQKEESINIQRISFRTVTVYELFCFLLTVVLWLVASDDVHLLVGGDYLLHVCAHCPLYLPV